MSFPYLINIYKNLMKVLEQQGLQRIDCLGKKFDHNLHEAVMTVQNKNENEDIIIEEVEAGYTLQGKVIMPSKVIVNKK